MEKVSIIIPVYNAEKTLARCLNSVVQQSYKNLEIIVVDDGSIDNSLTILNEYAEKYSVIQIIRQENKGVSSARNCGLNNATGDYISFIDSDDSVDSSFIEVLIDNCKKNNADICSVNVTYVYGNYIQRPLIMQDEVVNKSEYFERLLYTIKGFSVNKLFKRDIIKDIRFREDLKISEDFVFNIEVACNINKAILINKYLYNYYQDNLSATHKKYTIDNITELYALDRIVNIVAQQAPNLVDLYYLELTLISYKQKYEYRKSEFKDKEIWNQIQFFNKKYEKKIRDSEKLTYGQKFKLWLNKHFYFIIVILKKRKHSKGEKV